MWARPPLAFQGAYLETLTKHLRSSAHELTGAAAVNDWVRYVGYLSLYVCVLGGGVIICNQHTQRALPLTHNKALHMTKHLTHNTAPHAQQSPSHTEPPTHNKAPNTQQSTHTTRHTQNTQRTNHKPTHSNATKGRIPDLVNDGAVAKAVAVLVSAVYFKVRPAGACCSSGLRG